MNFKQNKFFLFFLFLVTSLLIQSCVSEKQTAINYYDLGIPPVESLEGINMEITPFLNYSEVSSEMLYRIESNKIDYDPSNRWAKSPNILLTTFFKNSLKTSSNTNNQFTDMTLCGAVTAFDIDLKNKKTILGINYKIQYKGETLLIQNKLLEQKFEKKNPSDFASSMSLSAAELLKTIRTQAKELKNNISAQHTLLKKNN